MSIIAMHQTSRPHELGRKANALVATAEKNNKEAGGLLNDLKLTKPRGITWEIYLKECGWTFGERWADMLIRRSKTPDISNTESEQCSEPDIENIEENYDDASETFKGLMIQAEEARALAERIAAYPFRGRAKSEMAKAVHVVAAAWNDLDHELMEE